MYQQAVGHVTGVHGFRIKVELEPERKSSVRADLDGAKSIIAINSYLTFELGGGEAALGIITDLEARESFDPASDDLTLELVRPRRIATLQLLGTLRPDSNGRFTFDPGITVLPTLDTHAMPAEKKHFDAVFSEAPKRNKPSDHQDENYDSGLHLGTPAGAPGQKALGSFNDLFSRPIAVVGNTGSGKSCTIAHLIQKATEKHKTNRPRFFVLDINGEYASAFRKQHVTRQPNEIYVNGLRFSVPVWLMNANEVCQWLSAAEQVQEPVLKNLWSFAKKTGSIEDGKSTGDMKDSLLKLDLFIDAVFNSKSFSKTEEVVLKWDSFLSFLGNLDLFPNQDVRPPIEAINKLLAKWRTADKRNHKPSLGDDEKPITDFARELRPILTAMLKEELLYLQESADKPMHFDLDLLHDPAALFSAAKAEPTDTGLQQNLRGLELRLRNRLKDKRWTPFRNYQEIGINNFRAWLEKLGIGIETADDVCVIDCSMLSYEVLPYACGIIGRTLLELREHVKAQDRFYEPWVLVLEEAHNYVRPRRQIEDRGIAVSREAFERIAKEGRKFGLSLIVASQRPSEISATVLSQCANFIMHRLQNPDDIEHFRSIVPSQSRRLMDQVTILGPGEAVVVGSAFHIPARVQVDKPAPEPASKSSAPHLAWQPDNVFRFNLDKAFSNWGIDQEAESTGFEKSWLEEGDDTDDDIPF